MAITVLAAVVARAGRYEETVAALSAYAEYTRAEPGTIVFQMFRDLAQPDTITMLEVYKDDAALELHARSEQRKSIGESLETLAESVTAHWLEPLAGHGIAHVLSPGGYAPGS